MRDQTNYSYIIVSSRVGTLPFSEGTTPLSGYPPLSEANLKSYSPPPLFLRSTQIVACKLKETL